jgi:hypothetical protein
VGHGAGAVARADRRRGLLGDLARQRVAERANNIVHWSEFDRGSQFAAMEAPDLLIADVREFFRRLRSHEIRGATDPISTTRLLAALPVHVMRRW